MAVAKEYQNLGIGSRLVKSGLQIAEAPGYKSVVVLGHPGFYPGLVLNQPATGELKPLSKPPIMFSWHWNWSGTESAVFMGLLNIPKSSILFKINIDKFIIYRLLSLKYDGFIPENKHPFFENQFHSGGQYIFFDIAAGLRHAFRGVTVIHRDHILRDNRPLVQVFRHKM